MRILSLSSSPNQQFTLTLDQVRWVLRFVETAGVMAADVTRDGIDLLRASRVLAGEALIPYAHLQTGNFIVVVTGSELPTYSQFGVSRFLVYLSAEEIVELNANPLNLNDLSSFVPSFLLDDNGFYLTTDSGEILTDD